MNEHEFWSIWQAMPEPKPVFWRLYYDTQGHPIVYSMEDLPGIYIDVDPATYAIASMNVRVRNSQLIAVDKLKTKLMPSHTGTACYPDNVAIVVPETEPHQRWSIKTYETN